MSKKDFEGEWME